MFIAARRVGRKGGAGQLVGRAARGGLLPGGGLQEQILKNKRLVIPAPTLHLPGSEAFPSLAFFFFFPSIVTKSVCLITVISQVSSILLLSHPDLSSRRVGAREAESLPTERFHTI